MNPKPPNHRLPLTDNAREVGCVLVARPPRDVGNWDHRGPPRGQTTAKRGAGDKPEI